ncbi:uncharacterized protein B0H18DRAFT_957921 [Fomitopsis serialis]|uniref:uncharacterized protein n=1 Tax=Fomitopsis serialis TaxID=139415 RepID=UPI0020075F34|nr:uncharacterized protein B0H18DRAFT_957921 [Neoantrodia serialis]KAH9918430.1 hypothetical protein B0H18DRAFT_957921 [Neoantrodia serialis]
MSLLESSTVGRTFAHDSLYMYAVIRIAGDAVQDTDTTALPCHTDVDNARRTCQYQSLDGVNLAKPHPKWRFFPQFSTCPLCGKPARRKTSEARVGRGVHVPTITPRNESSAHPRFPSLESVLGPGRNLQETWVDLEDFTRHRVRGDLIVMRAGTWVFVTDVGAQALAVRAVQKYLRKCSEVVATATARDSDLTVRAHRRVGAAPLYGGVAASELAALGLQYESVRPFKLRNSAAGSRLVRMLVKNLGVGRPVDIEQFI